MLYDSMVYEFQCIQSSWAAIYSFHYTLAFILFFLFLYLPESTKGDQTKPHRVLTATTVGLNKRKATGRKKGDISMYVRLHVRGSVVLL